MAAAMTNTTYLLLARHGKKDESLQSLPDSDIPLAEQGKEVLAVAAKLAEHLSLRIEEPPIVLGAAWYSVVQAGCQTAGLLLSQLAQYGLPPVEPAPKRELFPAVFWAGPADRRMQRLKDLVNGLLQQLREYAGGSGGEGQGPNAVLVVGHQPQLGWIAEQILGKPLPLSRAEVACLAIDSIKEKKRPGGWAARGRLLWVISPETGKAEEQLREKIKSKMELAGVLNGALTLFLGVLLGALLDPDKLGKLDGAAQALIYAATVALVAGLILSLATVYAYDRLLMPVPFWGEKLSDRPRPWLASRPPGPASWVLYQNMTRVWNGLFTPATWSVLLGVMLLALALFRPAGLMLLGIFALLAAAGISLYFIFRPVLGTED